MILILAWAGGENRSARRLKGDALKHIAEGQDCMDGIIYLLLTVINVCTFQALHFRLE